MSADSPTPLLDRVHIPADLRALEDKDLKQLAAELRQEMIDAVSVTGGHLGAGLGVVELTIALHKVFDTPEGPADLGRRPSKLSAQDLHRAARPHPHLARARRPLRFLQALRKRVRRVRRGPLLDIDLRRPRHGGRARHGGRRPSRRLLSSATAP